MISQNSNFGQVQNFMGEEDMIDQSFDQINQEISKALLEMKEEEKDPFKNESILNDNILANKPEIKNKVENQNNICFPNLFNNYNEIYPTLENKKGILHLDSGNHFEIKEQ